MRAVSFVLAALAAVVVIGVWWTREAPLANPQETGLIGSRVVITGPHNTLQSLARQIGNPELFSYDPASRTAVSRVSLIVRGRLQLGDPEDPAVSETLELDTHSCGDLGLFVESGGELAVYHSTITTVSRVIVAGACTRGYNMIVEGTLRCEDAHIRYISVSTSQVLRGPARAILRRTQFSQADGAAMTIVDVDGSRVTIEDCDFLAVGHWGVSIKGGGGQPVVFRRCRLGGEVAAIMNAGGGAVARLIDCDFNKDRIEFSWMDGQVQVAWTVTVQVTPPRSGLVVTAQSLPGTGQKERVRGITDDSGVARLVLTEWVATPRNPRREQGVNAFTPHRITVMGPGGRVLASVAAVDARGRGQVINIALRPTEPIEPVAAGRQATAAEQRR